MAAEKTRHIMLGSGVTSLPYHHPLLVAQRFVQLDHMTRGRAMLGCGPGALVSDAYMMGIDAEKQRGMMDQSLGAIMALLECKEPVNLKTDWFELRDARLHLKPYTKGGFPIAVASATTPSGALAAGKHGVGMLSLGAGLPGGSAKLADYWKMGEAEAAKYGKTIKRDDWRLVINMHCAETDELAMEEVRRGERVETLSYFSETLGRPPMRSENPLAEGLAAGSTLVGSPETIIAGIERLLGFTGGGAGAVLFRSHEWANREQTLRSYELFARWVMPRFQGSVDTTIGRANGAAKTAPGFSARRWGRSGRLSPMRGRRCRIICGCGCTRGSRRNTNGPPVHSRSLNERERRREGCQDNSPPSRRPGYNRHQFSQTCHRRLVPTW